MIKFFQIIVSVFGVAAAAEAQFTDEQARAAAADWHNAVNSSNQNGMDAQALSQLAERYRTFLDSAAATPSQIHLQETGVTALIDLTLAKAWAAAGDFNKAAQHFEAEVKRQHQKGGDFLQTTPSRNRIGFVNDVFELHSMILVKTGIPTPIAGLGYQVFAVPSADEKPRFAFAYRVDGKEEAQIEIQDLDDQEERLMIRLSERDPSKHFRLSDPAQVIGKQGEITVSAKALDDGLALTLAGVTKLIEYSDAGNPKVHLSPLSQFELFVSAGKLEQPLAAVERARATTNGNTPKVVVPPTKAIPPEGTKPPPPREEVESSLPQIVVAVLILAVIGLLWWLLKNRR